MLSAVHDILDSNGIHDVLNDAQRRTCAHGMRISSNQRPHVRLQFDDAFGCSGGFVVLLRPFVRVGL